METSAELTGERAGTVAAEAGTAELVAFLKRTYMHVLGAVLAFVALECVFFELNLAAALVPWMLGTWWSWLVVLGLFMGASMLAERMASAESPIGTQYAGLALYVGLEALIFLPLLYVPVELMPAEKGANILFTAAGATILLFGGLTAVVFITGKDFGFLRGVIGIGMIAAIGLIVASALFGFNLGIFFTVGMLALASGVVLYQTSQVTRAYPTHAHVAASLALVAALGLMFWYVLQLLLYLYGEG